MINIPTAKHHQISNLICLADMMGIPIYYYNTVIVSLL